MGAETIAAAVAAIFRSSNVIAGWLFTYWVHSSLWIVAALAVVSLTRLRRRPAWQHAVWMGAMLAGVASTALQLTGVVQNHRSVVRVASGMNSALGGIVIGERRRTGEPTQVRLGAVSRRDLASVGREEITVERRVSYVAPTLPNATTEGRVPTLLLAAADRPVEERRLFVIRPDMHEAEWFSRTFVLAAPVSIVLVAPILIVAALLVARLLSARAQLARVMSASRDATHSTAGIALQELVARAGVHRPVSLAVSNDVSTPAAVSSSRIMLPRRMLAEFTLDEQEAVMAHELAHVVRRDTFWLQLALFVEQLAWFQPLNRLARRRMELAAEFAADSWAVRLTRSPIPLARAIAHVAEWFTEPPRIRLQAAFGAAGSPLMQRVRSLTGGNDVSQSEPPISVVQAMVLAAMLAMTMSLLPRIEVGRSGNASAAERRTVWLEHRA